MSGSDKETRDSFPEKPERMSLLRDGMRGPELASLYREMWRLAWPAFFGQGIRSIVMFLVRIIVGQLGDKAYNSINIGMMVFMVIMTVIAAVAVGTTALVAQSWGAGDRARAGRILQQSLLWGFIVCVVIAIIGMPLSRLLFRLLGADPETIRMGASFMIYLFASTPVLAPGFFLAAGLRAAGDTRTPMIVGIIMGFLALILSYGLILGKLGMPALGTTGAALGIIGSFSSFTLILGLLFVFNKTILKLPLTGWRLDVKIGLSMFKIGIPSALEWILIQVGMLLYIFVIYRYGDAPAAGYFTGVAMLAFAQTPGHGFQVAAATMVGQSVGARRFDRAESVFRHCALLSFIFMIIIGVIIYLVSNPTFLSFLFSELSDDAIRYARLFITLLVFNMPLMGVSFSMAGGLRGAGDTIPPLVASTVGVYGGRILAAFGMYTILHPPVVIIWCSMFPDLILRITVMAIRLASGRWKRPKI
jgi:putative MATE family efflux protein